MKLNQHGIRYSWDIIFFKMFYLFLLWINLTKISILTLIFLKIIILLRIKYMNFNFSLNCNIWIPIDRLIAYERFDFIFVWDRLSHFHQFHKFFKLSWALLRQLLIYSLYTGTSWTFFRLFVFKLWPILQKNLNIFKNINVWYFLIQFKIFKFKARWFFKI